MASKTISFLKTENRDFNNVFDSYLNLTDGGNVTGNMTGSSVLVTGTLNTTGTILGDGATDISGVRRPVLAKTTNYEITTADSGKIIQVNPGGTTLIQLPAAADNAGFYCTIVITEDDGGAMDQIVNIGTLAGEFFNGIILGADGGGGLVANGTSNDFVNCKATATSGERFEIFSDGTRMHITGFCFDASDTVFADTAAS